MKCRPLFECRKRTAIWLLTLIAIQLALFAWLGVLSREFRFESAAVDRPLLSVLVVLAAAFAAYLCSIPLALRLADSLKWIVVFFVAAVAMRTLVLSEPIQEVDIYRYIWDGAVSGEGISPYRYPPWEVTQAMQSDSTASGGLKRLALLAANRPGLGEVLRRVHYSELPTVYPPVSQAVFSFSNSMTPPHADVTMRLRVMKSVIVLFDLGVMFVLFALLKMLGMNPGWCIVYGWSPLVMKEFANSGHLDSIAVFLCVAAIFCLAAAYRTSHSKQRGVCLLGSGLLLGLGVGAKLYPIVLLPLVACLVWKRSGWGWSIGWASTACLVIAITLLPMVSGQRERRSGVQLQDPVEESSEQLAGLKTFLSRWEINDLLFMVVEENIRPEGSVQGQPHLWFAVTSNAWRLSLTRAASAVFGGDLERTPFLLTRLLTTLVFGAIVCLLCRRTWRDPSTFYEGAFLTLAWFWLLSPTQNPWYWTWALPLVPFARTRLWLLVSGLTLVYYSRFWFEYHASTPAWGFPYQGVAIFDFVIVWFEFAPFLLLLSVRAIHTSGKGLPASPDMVTT